MDKTKEKINSGKRSSATHTQRATERLDKARGSRKRRAHENTIVLPETLNIREMRDWHTRMRKIVETGGPVTVDGSRVERADTASLQLITALYLSLRGKGVACSWKDPSLGLRDSMDRLGLSETVGLQA